MKKHIVTLLTLLGLIVSPLALTDQHAKADSPKVFVGLTGDNGYIGMTSDGAVHYTLTNDGFKYYGSPSYGHCKKHHCTHRCRYVAPPKHNKHPKKHDKKHHHDNGHGKKKGHRR